MLPLGHGLEQILWNQLSNGKWTWDLEDEISAMFIENNSKRTVEEYLLFWGKKNVKWNNRKWKKLNKLWQNFRIQQRTKKGIQSFGRQNEVKVKDLNIDAKI